MKIALCLYGTIGGTKGKAGDKSDNKLDVFQHAFPHYKKFILDINDIDVFIHSWDTEIEDDVVENYQPKLYNFEPQIKFEIPDHIENTQRVQNHFSRWYSCKEALNFKKQYENENLFKYDFVMLSRQDLAWQIPINFSFYDTQYFYVPNWFQQITSEPMGFPNGNYNKSLQDICFFSNSEYMDMISEIYDNISEFHMENPELAGYKGISNHRLLYYKLFKMEIIPDKLRFAMRYDNIKNSEMPLVRWLYFGEGI